MQKTMHTYLDCNICLVILKISIQSVFGFFFTRNGGKLIIAWTNTDWTTMGELQLNNLQLSCITVRRWVCSSVFFHVAFLYNWKKYLIYCNNLLRYTLRLIPLNVAVVAVFICYFFPVSFHMFLFVFWFITKLLHILICSWGSSLISGLSLSQHFLLMLDWISLWKKEPWESSAKEKRKKWHSLVLYEIIKLLYS